MIYLNKGIQDKIASNSNILDMLALNKDYLNTIGTESKENSIVLDMNLERTYDPMYIVFGFGTIPSIGKSRLAQLFVRVYDVSKANPRVELGKLKELVRDTLDDKEIVVSQDSVEERYYLRYESEEPIRTDEAFNHDFIELEFQVLVP